MPTKPRILAVLRICAVAGVLAGAGCSGGNATREKARPIPTTEVATALRDPQPTPRPRLADAVRDLLAAERAGDHQASFLLLSRQSREEYADVADWTARRQELPAVTGFRIDPGSDGKAADAAGLVVAVVEHEPGLDPFKGLSPARDTQTFTGRREGAGWLVDGDPKIEPILPPEPLAVEAAAAWVSAVQSCDQGEAAGLQAVSTLFGSARGAAGLCGKTGPVTPGAVGRLSPGIASTDIVAQYTTDALVWARVVRVTSPSAFGVVLAPIGDGWKVLGVTD